MRTRKPQVFATNLHKNVLEHDGPRTQRWYFALTKATIRGPEATIRTTGGDDSPSDGRKQSRRIDPSEQQFRGRKRRHGAPLQRFLPWLAENVTMGPLEASRSRRKSSKRGGEARKATEKPPMGPRMSYWAHAVRPPIGVFCHPASKTAQPPLPAKKSLLNATSI